MSKEETRVDTPHFATEKACWDYISQNYVGDKNQMMVRLRGMGYNVSVAPVKKGSRWYVNIIYRK